MTTYSRKAAVVTHEEWARVCAALEDLDSAHHAYTHAALSGYPSVDRYRTRLHETRERLEDEWGFDTRVASRRRAAPSAPKRSDPAA
jgi:hypothetical protein